MTCLLVPRAGAAYSEDVRTHRPNENRNEHQDRIGESFEALLAASVGAGSVWIVAFTLVGSVIGLA